VPASGQGIDAGKKIAGRKRPIGVDTLGLLLAGGQRSSMTPAASRQAPQASFRSGSH
jgi:hypothetical protein